MIVPREFEPADEVIIPAGKQPGEPPLDSVVLAFELENNLAKLVS